MSDNKETEVTATEQAAPEQAAAEAPAAASSAFVTPSPGSTAAALGAMEKTAALLVL